MQKAISIKEDVYKQLNNMRSGELQSFTQIIEYLIKEKEKFEQLKMGMQKL